MKRSGLAYRRAINKKHQKRKLLISRSFISDPTIRYKGKVHCSCPLCSNKSTKCMNRSTNSLRYYSASDRRKLEHINSSLQDEEERYEYS